MSPPSERLKCPVKDCHRSFPPRFAMCADHWRLLGSVLRRAIVDEWHCMNAAFNSCNKCSFTSGDAGAALAHASATGHHLIIRRDHDHQAVYDAAIAEAARYVEGVLGWHKSGEQPQPARA